VREHTDAKFGALNGQTRQLSKKNGAIRTKAWKIDMEGKKAVKTLCPQALMA